MSTDWIPKGARLNLRDFFEGINERKKRTRGKVEGKYILANSKNVTISQLIFIRLIKKNTIIPHHDDLISFELSPPHASCILQEVPPLIS